MDGSQQPERVVNPIQTTESQKQPDAFHLPLSEPYTPPSSQEVVDIVPDHWTVERDTETKEILRNQQTEYLAQQVTEQQLAEARALLRSLPKDAKTQDIEAAKRLLAEAKRNHQDAQQGFVPARDSDPSHPARLDRLEQRANNQPPGKSLKDRFFGWIGMRNKEQKAA